MIARGSGNRVNDAALQIDDPQQQLIERQLAQKQRRNQIGGLGDLNMPAGFTPDVEQKSAMSFHSFGAGGGWEVSIR